VYGTAVEPRLILDEERNTVALPRLAEEADVELALLADLQIGMWWANTGMIERAVERAVRAEPDAVLLGGDFVYSTDPGIQAQVDTVLELLSPLIESGIPTFAVLGNHDYAVGAQDELTAALESRGIPVLLNEAAPLEQGGGADDERLYVVGLGPEVPGMVDADAALRDVPDDAPRIVLMHNPTSFPALPADTAPLAVAGHTHCGQIALPGTPRWSYLALTAEEKTVAEGWAPEGYGAPGNRLFVTCGIGFSVVPVRINAAPEIAFFSLTGPRR
jgi:predicted MPP superfamily phosphohydrolase